MATNGKKTQTALALIGLGQTTKFSVQLSLDDYHEPINGFVAVAFKEKNAIRSVTTICKSGSALENMIYTCEEECPCTDLMIKTNGDIKMCGCENSPVIGNIVSGIDEYWKSAIEDYSYSCIRHLERIGEASLDRNGIWRKL